MVGFLFVFIMQNLIYFENDWFHILEEAIDNLDKDYKEFIRNNNSFFPDRYTYLNAFARLPLSNVSYILFGQDPYPRKDSAIGEAFIDGRVKSIWSNTGLSKEVNRATSLRNIIKMLLVAHDYLSPDDLSQKAIAQLDKSRFIQSIFDLRNNFVNNGVLLLNTALVFTSSKDSAYHIKMWRPFIKTILQNIPTDITLILMGNFAKEYVGSLYEAQKFNKLMFPHPYNVSFITQKEVVDFFRPMSLLFKK